MCNSKNDEYFSKVIISIKQYAYWIIFRLAVLSFLSLLCHFLRGNKRRSTKGRATEDSLTHFIRKEVLKKIVIPVPEKIDNKHFLKAGLSLTLLEKSIFLPNYRQKQEIPKNRKRQHSPCGSYAA